MPRIDKVEYYYVSFKITTFYLEYKIRGDQ